MTGDTTQQPKESKSATVADLPQRPFRKSIDLWILGLTQATIQGGAVALKAFFGAAGLNQILSNVPPISVQQAAGVFLAGAAYHFVDYLVSNRLPAPVA